MRQAIAKIVRNKNGLFSVRYRGKIVASRLDIDQAIRCAGIYNEPRK